MNTPTITPSAHLPAVENLLKRLDDMEGQGTAQQRLDLLLEEGPKVVPGFNFEDAFDRSLRAQTERLQELEELRGTMDALKARWHDSPLEDDVKKAGNRLIGHLSEFVRQARTQERDLEAKTLSTLWEGAPNVFPVFGLPTPSYYPKDDPGLVREAFDSLKKRLLKEVAQEGPKLEGPKLEGPKLEGPKLEGPKLEGPKLEGPKALAESLGLPTSRIAEEKTELEELQVRVPLQVGTAGAGDIDGDHIVGQVHPRTFDRLQGAFEDVTSVEPPLEEVDMVAVSNWTFAFNEVLTTNWRFDRQLHGRVGDRARMGVTLLWKRDPLKVRLDIERLNEGEFLVRMVPPRSSRGTVDVRYRVYATEMKSCELAQLHKDPTQFVRNILRSTS